MAKRTMDGQPMPSFIHQIAPEPALQSTTSISAPSTDDHSAVPQQNASGSTEKRKSHWKCYWTQPGITPFVDWITDQENYNRLYKQRSISGERIIDIHTAIAEYVNARASTTWTSETVKQKVSYAKNQYTRAVQLVRKAGEGEDAFLARRLDLCPYFDRFHAVYAFHLPSNAPPRQLRRHPRKRMIEESSSEASDFEDYPDHSNEDGNLGNVEDGEITSWTAKDNDSSLANKRQRQDRHPSLDSMGAILDDLKRQASAMATTNGSLRASWEEQHAAMLSHQRLEHEKALQQCVQERENMLQQRVQEREKMLQQRAQELDEVYDRRRRELEADKEALAAREKLFLAKEERLAVDRAKFLDKVEAFQNERVNLFGENQKLQAKLDMVESMLKR
ncbi:hypothetical protein BGZ68_006638 [Mortierella alpina]|nr:hypothetical protein BGZ68_006638 [Mortierella alpina]